MVAEALVNYTCIGSVGACCWLPLEILPKSNLIVDMEVPHVNISPCAWFCCVLKWYLLSEARFISYILAVKCENVPFSFAFLSS